MIISKADMLRSLYGKLKLSRIEKIKVVTCAEFEKEPYSIAGEIAGYLKEKR